MGRPSLANQRRKEILEAFERCIARYGLAGSSSERIAEEAGMQRSILRHYIGNRDDLIEALAEKVMHDYRAFVIEGFGCFSKRKKLSSLLDFLLPSKSPSSEQDLRVIDALIGAADDYPNVRQLVKSFVDDFVVKIANLLNEERPKATKKQCWNVAYGLVCLSFNHDSLQPLQLEPKYLRAAWQMAQSMLDTLPE